MKKPQGQMLPALQGISTLLHWEVWRDAFQIGYVLSGLREGFRIGYNYQAHKCKKCDDSIKSAKEFPQVSDEYITKECRAGRLLGPIGPTNIPRHPSELVWSYINGRTRKNLDLPSPECWSMNAQ